MSQMNGHVGRLKSDVLNPNDVVHCGEECVEEKVVIKLGILRINNKSSQPLPHKMVR